MRPIRQVIKKEIVELTPAFLYFLVAFNIIGLTDAMVLRQYGIDVPAMAHATLGAVVMAKVVLIVGVFPFMEPFPKIPIGYNVLWKTVIYTLASLLVQLLERGIELLWQRGSLTGVSDVLWSSHFWAIQIWLFVLFLVFFSFKGVIEEIGPAKTREIFLGIRTPRKN